MEKEPKFKLGIGLLVSDVLFNDLDSEHDIMLTPLKEREAVEYGHSMKEFQIICKNEDLILTHSKNFLIYDTSIPEECCTFNVNEFVLVKELNLDEDPPGLEESLEIGKLFSRLQDYFKLETRGLFYFFYFPENIIIDDNGEDLIRVEYHPIDDEEYDNYKNMDEDDEKQL